MRILRQELYFPIIVGLHFVLWAIDLAMLDGGFVEVRSDTFFFEYSNEVGIHPMRVLGEVFSSWVVTVFAFNFLMATRARWVERLFGGLDKMYMIHRRSGVIAVVLLVAHFVVVPRDLTAFTPGKPLGFWAFVLIIVGVVLSAAPPLKRKLPYHVWLRIHRLMGVFYVMGVIHAGMVFSLIQRLPLTRAYVFGMAALGVGAWVYRAFIYRFVHPELTYEVDDVRDLGHGVTEVWLSPKDEALAFKAGQFAFFGFPEISKSERHPFTISSAPGSKGLRITVKNLGDFSGALAKKLKPGSVCFVEGPFGHFSAETLPQSRQVWVAGGIGITPFLSMAAGAKEKTHLYWCVASEDEATYKDELQACAESNENFDFTVWPSDVRGYLNQESIGSTEETAFMLCGPAGLKESLIKGLASKGVRRSDIYDEEFVFR